MKHLSVVLAILLACGSALAQTTAIRPDQIQPGTPDITTGMDPTGNKFQIGTTIPWRTDTTAAPALVAADNAKIVELTFNGAIAATVPDATGSFGDGFGFTIQVGPGTLTLNRQTTSTINGQTSIVIGPWQSVALSSRSSKWYASLSVPQPSAQTGGTVLADNMTWRTVAAGPATITAVAPSSGSFYSSAPVATTIAAVGVTMSPATPTFSGTLALANGSTGDAGCTGATVAASNFQLSSTSGLPSNLQTAVAPLAPGTYCVHLVATQAGATGSPFTQVVVLTSTGLALSAHGVGTGGTATAATTATVTLTGVAAGDRHVLFWLYCTSSCGASGNTLVNATIAGTLGSTCVEVPAVQLAINNGVPGYDVVGGGICTATTSAGNDTFTVTFASGVQYGQVWAVGYHGALTGEDTACRNKTSTPNASTWSLATLGNLSAAPEVVVSFLVNGNNPTIVPTPSAGTLLDGAGTNVGQTSLHLIGGTAGSPVTLNGTWPTASYSGQVVLCMH